jgi:tRNA dimethylallyltransferase
VVAAGNQKKIVALFGPTGIGKTSITIALAKLMRERGEDPVAISADALQIYSGLEILTAAPTESERAEIDHRLVGVVAVDETFSAGEYARRAHREIDKLLEEGRRPIVVGGTGLYLRAALADLDLLPPSSPESRAHWQSQVDEHGALALHERLAERDSEVARTVIPTDSRRIVRAHELLDAGLKPTVPTPQSELWATDMRHPTLLIGLTMDRESLVERIEARVDAMVDAGVIEEVQAAVRAGASVTARKALGFQELLESDVEATKIRTRQYAKRQLTWLRKLPNVHTIDVTNQEPATVAQQIVDITSA